MVWYFFLVALYFVAYHMGIEEGRRRKAREDNGGETRVQRILNRWFG